MALSSINAASASASNFIFKKSLLLLLVGTLAACGGEEKSADTTPAMSAEEMRIAAEKERLTNAEKVLEEAGLSSVSVTISGDRATLSGSELSEADQEKAKELVNNVLGINWIDDEFGPSEAELQAQREEEERMRAARAKAQAEKDEKLGEAANAAIEELGFEEIDVSVKNSVVTLSGRSAGAIEDGDIIAAMKKIRGVRSVESKLTDINGKVITDAQRKKARKCAENIFATLEEDTIQFNSGSSRLTDDSLTIIDNIAEAMNACPGGLLAIYGHTDSAGGASGNLRISQARADAVAAALAERGVNEANLGTQGFGESRPIADNSTAEGRATNRRIEFKFSL